MVVFTCQHCGSSVNKNKVEKHYIGCRNSPFLTCVDCLKDFRGDEYVVHTQCVTEEERYAPKGFVAKIPPSVKKRATWLNSVETSLNTPGLTNLQRKFIESILTHSNIPQKKKKFENFVNSSLSSFRPRSELIDSVFAIINETHKKNLQEGSQNNNISNQAKIISCEENDVKSENNGINNGDTSLKTEESKKAHKKKKKSSISEHNVNDKDSSGSSRADKDYNSSCEGHDESNLNGILEMEESQNGKDNKKKHSNLENNKNLADIENNCEVSEENNLNGNCLQSNQKLSKKEKKEKKKLAKYEAELKEIESYKNLGEKIVDNNDVITEDKKKKKKDKNKKKIVDNMENEVTYKNGSESNKRTRNDENENDEPLRKKSKAFESENFNESADINDRGGNTFNWSEMIIKVLESRSGKELSVNRLRKKLINEYQAIFGEDHKTYEKLLSKFNKKLHKTPGVKVLKDKAKLKT